MSKNKNDLLVMRCCRRFTRYYMRGRKARSPPKCWCCGITRHVRRIALTPSQSLARVTVVTHQGHHVNERSGPGGHE